MAKINKVDFEVEKDGVQYKVIALKPDLKTQQQAQVYRAKKFGDFIKAGVPLQSEIASIIDSRKLFDDEKRKKYDEIESRIEKNELIVEGKDKSVTKLTERRKAAIELRIDRAVRVQFLSEFSQLQNNTAESMADDEKFNYLVSHCTFYADKEHNGKKLPYFESLDNYLERANDEDAELCAIKYANIYYGYDDNFDAKLPENQFLKNNKMCDDKLRLLDNKGRLIDYLGRLINKEGLLVDEEGKVIEQPKREEVAIEDDWTDKSPQVGISDVVAEIPKELEKIAEDNSKGVEEMMVEKSPETA